MKKSQVIAEGRMIIKTIYAQVLKSDDKDLWERALDSMHSHIYKLEIKVRQPEATNHDIRNLWYWNSARRQFVSKFGKKFISKK